MTGRKPTQLNSIEYQESKDKINNKITSNLLKEEEDFSEILLNEFSRIGVKKSVINKLAKTDWTEEQILNEIKILEDSKNVSSVAAVLVHRVINENPTPVKKLSPDDGQKYLSGEWAAFINH